MVTDVRVWFKLEGAASADFVNSKLPAVPPEPIIGDAIYANKAKLKPQRVVSADLRKLAPVGECAFDG